MGRFQGLLNPTSGSAGGTRLLYDSSTGGYTTIGNNEYPVNISWSSCGWYASGSVGGVTVYLCDENGGNQILLFQETWAGGNHNTAAGSKTINARDLRGKVLALYIVAANSASQGTVLNVSGDTTAYAYAITVGAATGGSAIASSSSAAPGATVTLTAMPATGYQHTGWTNNAGVTISNNKFTMPSSAITVTPVFSKIHYTITPSVTPAGAGIISVAGTAEYGDSVAVSQTAANGYAFDKWEISGGIQVVNGAFSMPDRAVTVKAKYYKLTTGTLNSTTLVGGTTAILTAYQDSTEYDHEWMLTFPGVGTMGGWTGGGQTKQVQIPIPTSWANRIPNDTEMTGGTLTITTKKLGVTLGQTQITGLTYQIPADAAPTMGTVTGSVLRTVNGHTYAYQADIYVQNHSGITVGVGVCSGKYSATIESVRVQVNGYTGQDYDRTYTTGLDQSITFNSGALTVAGPAVITVLVTDSRGLTATETLNITVTAYAAPTITELDVWRVNSGGTPYDFGTGAQYSYAYSFAQIGDNAAHAVLTSHGTSVTDPPASDWLMPNDHKNYSILYAYDVTLTVTDLFESVSMTAALPSGRFIQHFSADGNSVAFGHAVEKTPGTGYTGTFEIDGSMEVWVGNMTLKDYIQGIINGTI